MGIYDDPLVLSGEVEGFASRSQVRFQNDLYNDNLVGSADVITMVLVRFFGRS